MFRRFINWLLGRTEEEPLPYSDGCHTIGPKYIASDNLFKLQKGTIVTVINVDESGVTVEYPDGSVLLYDRDDFKWSFKKCNLCNKPCIFEQGGKSCGYLVSQNNSRELG